MQLELTDEQRMLAETVKSLLDKRYDANSRLELLRSEQGFSRDMWRQYADLGLLGLTFDEQYGGAGMGADELASRSRSLRPGVGPGAVLRDGGAGRPVAGRGRDFGAKGATATRCRGWGGAARACHRRTAVPVVPDRHPDDGGAGRRRLDAHRREDRGHGRRRRRSAAGHRAAAGRRAGAVPRPGRRAATQRLPAAGRLGRRGPAVGRDAGATIGRHGGGGRPPRARRRHRAGNVVRRGGRRHGPDVVAHRRLPQDAGAVRSPDRGLPGAAVPRGGHVRLRSSRRAAWH